MSACPRCGAQFGCGAANAASDGPCWCTRLPPLDPRTVALQGADAAGRCFCPRCLRELLAAAPDDRPGGPVG
jgi:hypothetical protein